MKNNKKIRVAILFGGKSAEHEVSLRSAKNIIDALDKEKYESILIGIDKTGRWLPAHSSSLLLDGIKKLNSGVVGGIALLPQENGRIIESQNNKISRVIDVVFPVLHGPFGEDGTVQGLLKLANVPFVGSDVIGSAVGMDKDVMKRLLRDANIPIAKFLVFDSHERSKIKFSEVKDKLGLPFFIKPANMGSSVGISKVHNINEFSPALKEAFNYDRKILIEEFIAGREIECSVLGNEIPIASLPGEVFPGEEFYSYDAKYIDEKGTTFAIPADLTSEQIEVVQSLAVRTFKVTACEGMARVDFFLNQEGKFIVSEVNTIPGFTAISMYPKLWEKSGINYSDLVDKLISLAIDRFKKQGKLKTSK